MFACWMLKVVGFMRTWFRLMRNGGTAEWWWGQVKEFRVSLVTWVVESAMNDNSFECKKNINQMISSSVNERQMVKNLKSI